MGKRPKIGPLESTTYSQGVEMPRTELSVGLRFGRLEVVDIGAETRTSKVGEGVFLDRREHYALARCECGNTIKLWVREWVGVKKAVKDCGCKAAALDGVRVVVCMALKAGIVADVKRMGLERTPQRNFSQMMEDLVKLGIKCEREKGVSDETT
jgi:hypothetical protein